MTTKAHDDLPGWFSTYGLVTAQRILERYKINLSQEDLVFALKTPNTFYHRLLQVPMRNVFNGIILQQAYDYQLYAQKIFVDYLLSGESNKDEAALGAATREELEEERQALLKISEEFQALELAHEKLIAKSQAAQMKQANDWHDMLKDIAITIKNRLTIDKSLSVNVIIGALTMLLSHYDFVKGDFKE